MRQQRPKQILLNVLLILLSSSSFSQDYTLFNANTSNIYEDQNGYYYSIKFDSAKVSGSDTILKTFIPSACCAPTMPDNFIVLTGTNVVKKQTGTFLFLNSRSDTVIIETELSKMSKWRMLTFPNGDYLQASFIGTSYGSILERMDSIRSFALEKLNINGAKVGSYPVLKVSKNYGLVSAPFIYTIQLNNNAVTLVGNERLNEGTVNITTKDIYDFEIGDEFHYYTTNRSWPYYLSTEDWQIDIVSSKMARNDSVTYTFIRKQKTKRTLRPNSPGAPAGSPTVTTYDSSYASLTTTSTIAFNNTTLNLITAHPQYISLYTIQMTQMYHSPSLENRMMKEFTNTSAGSLTSIQKYGQGIGLMELRNFGNSSSHATYLDTKLLYFKKGEETWGSPLSQNLEPTVNVSDHVALSGPVIANNYFTFYRDGFFELSIYNLQGKLLRSFQKLSGPINLSLDFISDNNIYLYTLNGTSGYFKGKFSKNNSSE